MDGVVVVGQVGRDPVLRIPAVPEAGGSTAAMTVAHPGGRPELSAGALADVLRERRPC